MSEDKPLNAEQLVLSYLQARDTLNELEEQYEKVINEAKAKVDAVSKELLDLCQSLGSDSIRTPAGTISRRVNTRYWTSDWESMYNFVKEHDAFHLLERRLSNGNLKEFLEENPDLYPMGLNKDSKYAVSVRKAKK